MKAGSKPANPVKPESACHCGRAFSYADCCGRYHAGEPAPTAEALMRSRYSAYVLSLEDYLQQTWAEETRPPALDLASRYQPKWLGLQILHAEESGDTAVVEFVARCKINGRAGRMQERSRFARRNGRWFYLDGEFPADS
jgi:SEC-C motif-containing protein